MVDVRVLGHVGLGAGLERPLPARPGHRRHDELLFLRDGASPTNAARHRAKHADGRRFLHELAAGETGALPAGIDLGTGLGHPRLLSHDDLTGLL